MSGGVHVADPVETEFKVTTDADDLRVIGSGGRCQMPERIKPLLRLDRRSKKRPLNCLRLPQALQLCCLNRALTHVLTNNQ